MISSGFFNGKDVDMKEFYFKLNKQYLFFVNGK